MQFRQYRLRTRPSQNDLSLNTSHIQNRSSEDVERDIRQIVRSVRFELVHEECALRLLGPDTSYHHIDPYLPKALRAFGENMTASRVQFYKSEGALFHLCFEDSWSGYFLATLVGDLSPTEELVLIHLDDHEDMMPTLLTREEEHLVNPTTGEIFAPSRPHDWEDAIHAGCIGIGNFITPLFYSGHLVHVRHLNNGDARCDPPSKVTREDIAYDYFPGVRFAALRRHTSACENSVGTYVCGASADAVLFNLPKGRIVVHIDLDYFINDFNGNTTGHTQTSDEELRAAASIKMDHFFAALRRNNAPVAGWIVATSPGFCSARHWDFLLAELEGRIRASRR